ncbi:MULTISPECIES: hypothetical protein [unclassified Curtobacterium]|uniref:PH-like domain-containing protein n=1 Tax=unclassified Curtobacterium TaxID=257496 RepID=UPI000DAA543D|nr:MULTISPECIES: hypothetical protein [unclassified Curtobacterium]PZE77175.1 hypothetical protein DEI82_04480 [Curtobacterium sp. MCBD17_019]WIB62304.1 hypothetical protein DEI94_08860 [Curtobacterium sp. MCBD17_040]
MTWSTEAVILLVIVALLVVMARTWRRRGRGQDAVVPPVPVPPGLHTALGSWDGLYVATTRADQPLERIVGGGLGFRGRAALRVHDEGVVLSIAGEPERFVDRRAVRGADRATWAIDRVVERGGLVRLRWRATGAAGATDLDSYFRFPSGDAAPLAALRELTQTTSPVTGERGPDTGDGGEPTR